MFVKEGKSNEAKYTSCIKINGVPILPPLITHVKRKEIHKYRQRAIKLEKRIKREDELRRYINKYYMASLESSYPKLLVTNTLEHKLSFEDALSQSDDTLQTRSFINEIPTTVKISHLSCDLQVSQYANNEFTVLTTFKESKSNLIHNFESECTDSSLCISKNNVDMSNIDGQKPRLNRSNSYILETPSPMLLEHLKNQNNCIDTNVEPCGIIPTKLLNKDDCVNEDILFKNLSKKKMVENEYIYQEDQNFYIDDLNNADALTSESELRNISCYSDQTFSNGGDTVLKRQYDLRQFIDNNVPEISDSDMFLNQNIKKSEKVLCNIKNNCDTPSCIENLENNPNIIFDESSLKQILNNIPEIYSKQIIELLEKQRKEQLLENNEYKKLQYSCICDIELEHEQNAMRDCTFHMLQTTELFSGLDQNLRNTNVESSLIIPGCNMMLEHNKDINFPKEVKQIIRNETVLKSNPELLLNHMEKIKQHPKEEHAASVIGAAARGYLVRRLMRTDRIQILIQTIRDALICAMQLHSENNDNINESDVELHRRLIQQVSAACFEFHDVFFSLSTSEQMTIIRFDRDRQQEKLKRPLSRTSSVSKSSRSSKLNMK